MIFETLHQARNGWVQNEIKRPFQMKKQMIGGKKNQELIEPPYSWT